MAQAQTNFCSQHFERAAPAAVVLPSGRVSSRHWRIELGLPSSSRWHLGADCVCGPVRKENEDFLVSISRPDSQVVVFADGCGGLPHGAAASRQAAITAASILASSTGPANADLLRQGIEAARYSMARLGEQLGITELSDGLRTTLVAVIASREALHLAYLGDGACDLVLPTGEVKHLLVPQRADAGNAASLAASLGPTRHGEPEFLDVARPAGSFVFCGTDGVFDRIPATGFHQAVIGRAIQLEGGLDLAVRETLADFGEARDATSFICDDNMTLAILGPGDVPTLAGGFWNHVAH